MGKNSKRNSKDESVVLGQSGTDVGKQDAKAADSASDVNKEKEEAEKKQKEKEAEEKKHKEEAEKKKREKEEADKKQKEAEEKKQKEKEEADKKQKEKEGAEKKQKEKEEADKKQKEKEEADKKQTEKEEADKKQKEKEANEKKAQETKETAEKTESAESATKSRELNDEEENSDVPKLDRLAITTELATKVASFTSDLWCLTLEPPPKFNADFGVSQNMQDLEGTWQLIWNRSESLGDIMYELGVAWWKRQALKVTGPDDEITMLHAGGELKPDEKGPLISGIGMKLLLPLGFVKSFDLDISGARHDYTDDDTGVWEVRTHYIDGLLVVRRQRKTDQAHSVETRCVFLHDPLKEVEGPVQIFQVRIKMTPDSPELVSTRWLKKKVE